MPRTNTHRTYEHRQRKKVEKHKKLSNVSEEESDIQEDNINLHSNALIEYDIVNDHYDNQVGIFNVLGDASNEYNIVNHDSRRLRYGVAKRCNKYREHNQPEKKAAERVRGHPLHQETGENLNVSETANGPSSIASSRDIFGVTPGTPCHQACVTVTHNNSDIRPEDDGLFQRAAMAADRWTLEQLESFAANYIINEYAVRDRIFNKVNSKVPSPGTECHPQKWREFRVHLFAEVCRRVRQIVAQRVQPLGALRNMPTSLTKLVSRYDLLKLAVQSEVSVFNNPLCTWAVQQLVMQLGRVACEQCGKLALAPHALPARALAPAISALQAMGPTVRCTRTQLLDIWRRLRSLKTRQLRALARAGDRRAGVRRGERLGAHDWELLDALLLYDDDEAMQLVTMSTLQAAASYRALLVLVRLLALAPAGLARAAQFVRGRGSQLLWSRVHLRYAATHREVSRLLHHRYLSTRGRTASVILLQRRYHQLRVLARNHFDSGAPRHPLLQFLDLEIGRALRDRKDSWSELVRHERCVLARDDLPGKQERKLRWYADFKKLEKLQTVNEIDEYIKRRLYYAQKDHKCGFWEHTECLERCDDIPHAVIHPEHASDPELNDDGNKAQNAAATWQALTRIDPSSARVTVLVESDTGEFVPDCGGDSPAGTAQGSADACPTPRVQSEWLQCSLGYTGRGKPKTVTCRSLEYFAEHRERADRLTKYEGESGERGARCDDTDTLEADTERAGCGPIDSKLLCQTFVNLIRVDETLHWRKYARNNTIDLKRAGLLEGYGGHRKALRPTVQMKTENEPILVDDCSDTSEDEIIRVRDTSARQRRVETERSDMSESVRLKNQSLLRACKPAVVRLRKLKESEIPRRGRVVKKVELPDIDEVRRINRSILTAQVKPIPLSEHRREEDESEQEGGGSGDEYSEDLVHELRQLDKDLRALFSVTAVERQAVINEAILSDSNKLHPITPASNSSAPSNIFLDEDEEEVEDIIPVTEEVTEPAKKKRKSRKTKDYEKPPVDRPRVLNAYEEWERQKRIANKYFEIGSTNDGGGKKRKHVTGDRGPAETGLGVDSFHEPFTMEYEAQNQGPPVMEVTKDGRIVPLSKPSEANHCKTKLEHTAPHLPLVLANHNVSFQEVLTDSFLVKLLNAPPKEPNVGQMKYLVLHPLETAQRVAGAVGNDDGSVISVDDDDDSSVACVGDEKVAVETPAVTPVTPVITAVCSLADTETIEDNAADDLLTNGDAVRVKSENSSTIQNINISEAAASGNLSLTMSLTPQHGNLTIRVGEQVVCKSLERTPNVLKVKVSTQLSEPEPPSTSQSLLQQYLARESRPPQTKPRAGYKQKGVRRRLNATDVKRTRHRRKRRQDQQDKVPERPARCGETCVPDGSAAPGARGGCVALLSSDDGTDIVATISHGPRKDMDRTMQVTTPELYIQTDRRKLLTVVKLDMWAPAWVINERYLVLTEKNLPCKDPGFWTVSRDPPGPCQFLIWPKSTTSHENTVGDNDQTVLTDYGSNRAGKEQLNDYDSKNVQIVIETNQFSDCKDLKQLHINEDTKKLSANESKPINEIMKMFNNMDDSNADEVLSIKQESDLSGTVIADTNEVDRCLNNQVVNGDSSDSDSESNKLQIVEDNEVDFSETNPNYNKRIDDENDSVIADVDSVGSVELNVDNINDSDRSKPDVVDNTSTVRARSIIKVKSFASVGRMEAKSVALNFYENSDIVEKDNKFYKKLTDAPVAAGSGSSCAPVYALIFSAVTSAEECNNLLREGATLQVLDRLEGRLHPLQVTRGDAGGISRVAHYDPAFIDDLAEQFRSMITASSQGHARVYVFKPEE